MAAQTCEFAWFEHGTRVGCLAPATIAVRWEMHPNTTAMQTDGVMCDLHWVLACQQLAADPEVVAKSIQLKRLA